MRARGSSCRLRLGRAAGDAARCGSLVVALRRALHAGGHGRRARARPARSAASPRRRWPARSRSQSPAVESTTWSAPARRSAAATSSRSSAAARGEALADPAPAGVDLELAAGLRVDEPEVAHRGQLELARVADLDRHDAVAPAQRAQRALPVALAAEVRHHDHEPAGARERRGVAHGAAQRGGPGAVGLGLVRAARRAGRAGRARPWRGRSTRGSPPPKATTPRRLPRRVATWPMASATPSATSALRRSAVPKAHRGRHVEQQPRGQRALADVHAHVRLAACARSRSSRCGARRRPAGRAGSSPARSRRRPAASGARRARGSRRGA